MIMLVMLAGFFILGLLVPGSIRIILWSMALGISLYLFMQTLYKVFTLVPSVKSMRHLTGIKKIGKREEDYIDKIIKFLDLNLKNHLEGLFRLDKDKRREIELNLKRVGSSDSYERYMMKMYFIPIISFIALFGFSLFLDVLLPMTSVPAYVMKIISVVSAWLLFFEPKLELRKKLDNKEVKIILEMPRFIRTYRYSPQRKGLYRIIEDYLISAKEGLEFDLTVLKADIDLVGEERALYNFAHRVNISEVREFVTVLVTSLKGSRKDADMNLYFVETKFQERADRIADDEMKKRPEVLDIINELLLQCLGALIIAPMAIQCFVSILNFMK